MPASAVPRVSAVLPAFNEEGNLMTCVGRVVRALQANTSAHEVIVVDDGSRDGTAAILEGLERSTPTLRVVRHAHSGFQVRI